MQQTPKTFQLYRHFDVRDRLLYVGISKNTVARLAQHQHRSHWVNDIARIDIEYFLSHQQLIEAERLAIAREHPLFNVAHRAVASVPAGQEPFKGRRKRRDVCSFDVSNVGRCIRETAAMVARLVSATRSVSMTDFAHTHLYVEVELHLHGGVMANELRLDELFEAPAPMPAPSHQFRMVTGATIHTSDEAVDRCRFTLVTPHGLTFMCDAAKGRRADYDAAYPVDIAPAIVAFGRVFALLERGWADGPLKEQA